MVYLSSFQLVAFARNLSLQQANSNICTLRFGLGGAPKMHNIVGLSGVRHLHLDR